MSGTGSFSSMQRTGGMRSSKTSAIHAFGKQAIAEATATNLAKEPQDRLFERQVRNGMQYHSWVVGPLGNGKEG